MRRFVTYLATATLAGVGMVGCERQTRTPSDEVAYAVTEDARPAAPATAAAAPPTKPQPALSPIAELNNTLKRMGAENVPEASGQTPGQETASTPKPRSLEELAQEVDALRADVKRLQDTVDLTISYVVGDLQEENRRLREEVARVYGVTPETADDGREVVVMGNGVPVGDPDGTGLAATPGASARMDYGEAGYKIIKEWGRSPEEVGQLGAKVPSLRGMICAVSPGLSDAELSDLGRTLRASSDTYDNIVIEAFDDEPAARAYADNNSRSTTHNVLSIQKDGDTGQDVITLRRNGVSIQVPR